MSTIPNAPEAASQEQYVYETAPTPRWVAIAFGILFIAVAWLLYAGYTSRKALEGELAKANQRSDLLAQQLNEQLADLRAEFDVTSQKLGVTREELARARQLAQAIRKEQRATDEQLLSKIGEVEKESETKIGEVSTEVATTKSALEAARKDLESRLERTVGDLGVQSGLIARNKEEVEELKRLGERNIFEFDLRKSKQFQHIGPIQLKLNKTDRKKYKYTMTVHADDKNIEKKDKTVNEPVQFYVRGARAPYEIVVFDVQKDRAVGYLSTPKVAARP